jgi:hypothetical protein
MAERYIPEHRRTQFKAKNTFKPEELRRRREEQQVEIRKAKREENLAKRRGLGTGENRPGASLGAAPDSDDDTAPTESQVCKLLIRALNFVVLLHAWRFLASAFLFYQPFSLILRLLRGCSRLVRSGCGLCMWGILRCTNPPHMQSRQVLAYRSGLYDTGMGVSEGTIFCFYASEAMYCCFYKAYVPD